MKISIKKKYIAGASVLVSITLGFMFTNELLMIVSQRNISILITPVVFFVSTTYAIYYFLELKSKEKMAEEISKEAATGDPQSTELIKVHLFNKMFEESYTINIFHKK